MKNKSDSSFKKINFGRSVPFSKHSQSGIIAAVLLILIVIVAAMVVMGFIVPFVQKQLEGGKCLDVVGKIEITNNLKYTCYNSTAKKMSVQIHYGDIEELIKGIQLTIDYAGRSKSFEITDEYSSDDISMLGGGFIELPGRNEERTYIIQLESDAEIPESIEVYPILSNGQRCDASESITSISNCIP